MWPQLVILVFVLNTVAALKPYVVLDTTLFCYEADMLKLHLAELNPLVDRFYITESRYTFQNNSRELEFPSLVQNPHIAPYIHKIRYLVVETFPSHLLTNWDREAYQRNYALNVMKAEWIEQPAIVLALDVDEVPNVDVLATYLGQHSVPAIIEMTMHYYSLSWMNTGRWRVAFLSPLNTLIDIDKTRNDIIHGRIRLSIIPNAGWHMSYFMSVPQIQAKLQSFSHDEYSGASYTNAASIMLAIASGQDIFHRGDGYNQVQTPADLLRPQHIDLLPAHMH